MKKMNKKKKILFRLLALIEGFICIVVMSQEMLRKSIGCIILTIILVGSAVWFYSITLIGDEEQDIQDIQDMLMDADELQLHMAREEHDINLDVQMIFILITVVVYIVCKKIGIVK